MSVEIKEIQEAEQHLRGVTIRTPMLHDGALSDQLHCAMYFKAECLQVTGSFKVRGAYNRMRQLTDGERKRGVIATSAGNHALGVAFSAKRLGLSATVVMPENAVVEKLQAVKALGAEVLQHGHNSTEMFAYMNHLAHQRGYVVIHPFDDPQIIAGQGTVGLEMVQDLPPVDIVLCAVSGGGLISGVATAVKTLMPTIEVIGVQPTGASAAKQSLIEGYPVTVERAESIADGLLAMRPGDITFAIMRRQVDDIVLVSEESILRAMAYIVRYLKVVTEPSGAVGLAAVLDHGTRFHGKRVAIVLSGGNVSPATLSQAVLTEL